MGIQKEKKYGLKKENGVSFIKGSRASSRSGSGTMVAIGELRAD